MLSSLKSTGLHKVPSGVEQHFFRNLTISLELKNPYTVLIYKMDRLKKNLKRENAAEKKSMYNFWPGSEHHCLPPACFAQDEGWGPTRSDHSSNEVDKLWFRMQSLGEKLKEANEHKESLHPWHREQYCPHQQPPALYQQLASLLIHLQ